MKSKITPDRRFVSIKDCRDSNWRKFGNWITQTSWDEVINARGIEDKYSCFMNKLTRAMDNFIPVTNIRIHQNDKPGITPTIKKCINDRQKSFFIYGKTSTEYKSCKYKTSSFLKASKAKYYQNKASLPLNGGMKLRN